MYLLYDYDSNAIITELIRNCSDKEILQAYNKLHQCLINRGCKPLLQRLDNKPSIALGQTIQEKDIDFQLVPPICTTNWPPSAQYKPSKTTLWQYSVALIPASHCNSGTASSHKPNSH
jgi:hypothetical protein